MTTIQVKLKQDKDKLIATVLPAPVVANKVTETTIFPRRISNKRLIKPVWDNNRDIGYMLISEKTCLKVSASTRDGIRYIHIHEFYRKADKNWRPGRKDLIVPLTIPLEKGTKRIYPYKKLLKMLAKAAEVASTMDLADTEHEIYKIDKELKK